MVKLWNLLKDVKQQDIINQVLDDSPEGLLFDSTSADGAFILLPRGGDFSEIKYLVNNIFGQAPLSDKAKVKAEQPTIEVRNGTWVNGLANQAARLAAWLALRQLGSQQYFWCFALRGSARNNR